MPGKLNRKSWTVDALKVIIGVAFIAAISGLNLAGYIGAFVQAADVVSAKSRGLDEDAMLIECRSLIAQRRRSEIHEIAHRGYQTYHTNEWRYLYGMACQFRYEDRADRSALDEAERLFRVYAVEVPYDPDGHARWGWCLSHLGRVDEARREFLKALALDPDNWAREKLKYVQPSSPTHG